MKTKFYFLFLFYTLLFLFYPGDSYYFNIFAFNRQLFAENKKPLSLKTTTRTIPVLKSSSYPKITAAGAYVVDLQSFTPIFEKNPHQKFLPASMTKIMTALVAYDLYKPDDVITIRKTDIDGQSMGLVRGEQITAENLLYGMLVYSGNDAAYAFAHQAGYNNFITLMNKKAKMLKMSDSNFKNPAGLDQADNYSSPYDLAVAARELLKNKLLAKIVSTRDITVSDVDFKYFHRLTNINKLLGEIQGLGGLKTGQTENAGENLVSFWRNSKHDFIIVIVKSEDRFADTTAVIDWLRTNVDYVSVPTL